MHGIMGRVGSGPQFFPSHGSGLVTLSRSIPGPRELIGPVKRPAINAVKALETCGLVSRTR